MLPILVTMEPWQVTTFSVKVRSPYNSCIIYCLSLTLTLGLDDIGCEAGDDQVASYENFAVFNVSQFQYIILIIVFSKGAPYRQSFYRNFPLIVDIIVLTVFCLFLTIWPDLWQKCGVSFESFAPPDDQMTWRWLLMALVTGNLVVSLLTEMFLADKLLVKIVKGRPKKHDLINQELESRHSSWPPLSPANIHTGVVRASSSETNMVTKDAVEIVDAGMARPNKAFECLFSPGSTNQTPSHSAAAVILNPPPHSAAATPRRAAAKVSDKVKIEGLQGDLTLSPTKSFATATSSPASSSLNTCKFLSCDTLDGQSEPDLDR